MRTLNKKAKTGQDRRSTIKHELNKIKSKLQPSIIRLARVGRGCVLGHDDVIARRPYSSTIICKSKSGELYWISRIDFEVMMSKNELIQAALIENSKEKDAFNCNKII